MQSWFLVKVDNQNTWEKKHDTTTQSREPTQATYGFKGKN